MLTLEHESYDFRVRTRHVDVSMPVAREPEPVHLQPGASGSILAFGEPNGTVLQVRDVWARRIAYGRVLTKPEEMFDRPFGSAHLRGASCANSYLCVTARAQPDTPGRADPSD